MTSERQSPGKSEFAHPVSSACIAAIVTAIPGVVGLLLHQLLLFPSLGPTAVMQASSPHHASSRPYNIVVAHLAGLGAAFLSVWIFGIGAAPSIFAEKRLIPQRVGAAALAILLGTLVELAVKASHPPAASTTLLAALGSFHPTWHDTGVVTAGVVIVTVIGEIARRLRTRGGGDQRPPIRDMPIGL